MIDGYERVLVFPPVSNFRRFLIHKLVGDTFPLLKTFSIGEDEARRTVICFQVDFQQEKPEEVPDPRPSAKRPRTMPSVGIYRPPAARKLERDVGNALYESPQPPLTLRSSLPPTNPVTLPSSPVTPDIPPEISPVSGKPCDARNRRRRPDMAVYVPRGQRIAQEHQRKLEAISLGSDEVELRIESPPFAELNNFNGQSKCASLPAQTVAVGPPQPDVKEPLVIDNSEPEPKDSNLNCNQLPIESENVPKENPESAPEEETKNGCNAEAEESEEIIDLSLDSSEEEAQLPIKSPVQTKTDTIVQNVVATESVPKPTPVAKTDNGTEVIVKKVVQPCEKLNPDEMDWDTLYDDSGECLDPSLMSELTNAVGKVAIEKPKTKYDEGRHRNLEEDFPHVVEIYNFPVEFKTPDLVMVFSDFKNSGFEIKWVDETHALGIFNNAGIVSEVLDMKHPFVKTRCLSEGSPQSKSKARKCADSLTPYTPRPDTCAALARRLVTGALGVKLPNQRAEREAERKILREAREKKKLAAKQREEAWEGTFS